MNANPQGGKTTATADAARRQGRAIFAFAAVLVFVFGLLARYRAIDDKAVLVAFSLGMDTIFVLMLIGNQKLIERRPPTSIDFAAWCFILILSAGSTLAMMGLALFAETLTVLGLHPLPLSLPHRFIYYFFIFSSFNFAGLWLRIQFKASENALRAASAESVAARAEMQRLRQQLAPHFLFNGLNLVAVEIPERPQIALDMLGELSGYLRYSLDAAELAATPVSAEMAALAAFLKVQSRRFEPHFHYGITAELAVRECMISPFLVQTLVQEAIRPGHADRDVRVDVGFSRNAGSLVVTVACEGTGAVDNGMDDLRNRLEMFYPGRHSLSRSPHHGGETITLRLSGLPS